MKLEFVHLAVTRTLVKHPVVQTALNAKTMTPAAAKLKPWYLRWTPPGGQKQNFNTKCSSDRDAIRAAKDEINGAAQDPIGYAAYKKNEDAKRSVTIGALAGEWIADGLPFRKTEAREQAAADRLAETLQRALPWWKDKAVATISKPMQEDYAGHRKPALRSADLELAALSCLCKWAVLTGRMDKNPFEKRAKFAKVKAHCHEFSADRDETLHRILAYMFEPVVDAHHPNSYQQTVLAAGTIAFCALTGLRPGEPIFLMRQPPLAETPANTKTLQPGCIFPDRTGVLRMKVQRLKRGQNPFVTLHPAAVSFLSAWRAWLARNLADETHLFPLGTTDQTTLNRALDRASAALELPHYKPHGFGRAFYVKVRRSQGEDDATIAGELGQSTNGELIRSVYGDPQDLVGGHMFDWLPEDAPAWDLLASVKLKSEVKLEVPAYV